MTKKKKSEKIKNKLRIETDQTRNKKCVATRHSFSSSSVAALCVLWVPTLNPRLGWVYFSNFEFHLSHHKKHLKQKMMKIRSVTLRSFKSNYSLSTTTTTRNLSSWLFPGNGIANQQVNKSESPDEFEQRIFSPGGTSKTDFILDKLNQQTKGRDRSGGSSQLLDDLEQTFDTLSDGMDGKLNNAARYFEYDPDEIEKDDYSYRYDTTFHRGSTYNTKDLDLTKPAARKPPIRNEFAVSTKDVLSQADFRNVRFLANFITEAGILIKRSKTGISAKAQRKVAREIKTARAFGLMPFTTMGTKTFVYGRTMENLDDDFSYRSEIRNKPSELDLEGDNV